MGLLIQLRPLTAGGDLLPPSGSQGDLSHWPASILIRRVSDRWTRGYVIIMLPPRVALDNYSGTHPLDGGGEGEEGRKGEGGSDIRPLRAEASMTETQTFFWSWFRHEIELKLKAMATDWFRMKRRLHFRQCGIRLDSMARAPGAIFASGWKSKSNSCCCYLLDR